MFQWWVCFASAHGADTGWEGQTITHELNDGPKLIGQMLLEEAEVDEIL